MSISNRHIIEKQFIDVKMRGFKDSLNFRNELERVCKEDLLPGLEILFDEIIREDNLIRIDKLEIDAGNISPEKWKTELTEKIIQKISLKIEEILNKESASDETGTTIIKKSPDRFDELLYFLERGYMPWHSGIKSSDEIKIILRDIININDENNLETFKNLLKKNENTLIRLVLQFESEDLDLIMDWMCTGIDHKKVFTVWQELLIKIGIKSERQHEILYKNFLKVFADDQISTEEVSEKIINSFEKSERDMIIEILQNTSSAKYGSDKQTNEILEGISGQLNKQEISDKEKYQEITDEKEISDVSEWYVINSGLVILHPFLLRLFENTGYIEDKKWISKELRHRAIALTQYAVTGKEDYPEFQLMLNKVICGFGISWNIPAKIKLSEFEKSEANGMLEAVIGHWTALKNSTPAGLRETFLMRDGKLSYVNNEWLLQVESKTADILLNKLPWGISVIKLPWMEEMMKVEWSY